jgi:hypothetical protein
MNERDDNFAALRKLLSLKQHEVPPPGFFNDFSSVVISRIRSGDAGNPDSLSNRLLNEAPWLFRLINSFQERPALAGVFASALLLLLAAGIVYTDNSGTQQEDLMPAQNTQNSSSMAAVTPPLAPSIFDSAGAQGISVSSTNPVLSLEPSLAAFGSQNPLFQSAGYSH